MYIFITIEVNIYVCVYKWLLQQEGFGIVTCDEKRCLILHILRKTTNSQEADLDQAT